MIEGDERDEARLLLSCELSATLATTDWGIEYFNLDFVGPRKVYDLLARREQQRVSGVRARRRSGVAERHGYEQDQRAGADGRSPTRALA
jgi:hypothetical protein